MSNTFLKTFSGAALAASLIAAAMTLGVSGNAPAKAQSAICDVHTLHGSYVFATHGWNIVGGVAVPKAIVEGIDFNGDGALVSPFATVSINGSILRNSGVAGSYTVDADCRGTVTFVGFPSFDIFVEPGDGKQVWMIQTGPAPAVFEGTATKVSP